MPLVARLLAAAGVGLIAGGLTMMAGAESGRLRGLSPKVGVTLAGIGATLAMASLAIAP